MTTCRRLIILLAIIVLGSCLFKDDSAVVKLTKNNFKSSVLESDELWLVEFYGMQLIT
jgi:hypothetical protein